MCILYRDSKGKWINAMLILMFYVFGLILQWITKDNLVLYFFIKIFVTPTSSIWRLNFIIRILMLLLKIWNCRPIYHFDNKRIACYRAVYRVRKLGSRTIDIIGQQFPDNTTDYRSLLLVKKSPPPKSMYFQLVEIIETFSCIIYHMLQYARVQSV